MSSVIGGKTVCDFGQSVIAALEIELPVMTSVNWCYFTSTSVHVEVFEGVRAV